MSNIKVSSFKAALARVSKLVDSKAVIAQFLENGQLWLHNQEGGAHAKTLVGMSKVEPRCVPLPSKLVMGLMSGAGVSGEEDLVLKHVARGMQLRFGGLSVTVDKALIESEIQPMETKDEIVIGTYEGAEVRDAFQSVQGFSAVKDTRINLQGVALFIEQGKLLMVATDGHRIAQFQSLLETSIDGFDNTGGDLIIPSAYTDNLIMVIDPEKEITISIVGKGSGRNIRFKSEDFVLTTTLWAGRFPDYKRAMEQVGKVDCVATCDRKTVVAAIKRISLVSATISFEMNPEQGCIKIVSADNESTESVDAVFTEGAKNVKMHYNPTKLAESIAAAGTEEVVIAVDSTSAPAAMIKIVRADHADWTAMLMPIRT